MLERCVSLLSYHITFVGVVVFKHGYYCKRTWRLRLGFAIFLCENSIKSNAYYNKVAKVVVFIRF